jgi:hypothetical protein
MFSIGVKIAETEELIVAINGVNPYSFLTACASQMAFDK